MNKSRWSLLLDAGAANKWRESQLRGWATVLQAQIGAVGMGKGPDRLLEAWKAHFKFKGVNS